ncbi:MAG: flavin reductase family protein [Chloroflexi bacterium]|nr:flavin reductase family protein [Chloroflexota bacterium]
MAKIEIGANTFLYPMPTVLVGANVDGKPTFLTVAYCGIMDDKPPAISVSSNKPHYTNRGIHENGTFSVNIPTAEMAEITDYCGLVSGHKVDKSSLFKVFYGKLETAPMIEECALNLECRLIQTLQLGRHESFIGEIVAVYSEERYLTNKLPDPLKMQPIIFTYHDDNYWRIGEHLGKAFEIGKKLKGK